VEKIRRTFRVSSVLVARLSTTMPETMIRQGHHSRIKVDTRRWPRGTGHDEKVKAGQEALYHRLGSIGAASQGRYTEEMETVPAASARAGEWEDD